jgi:DHA3 family tetracycline resistance protein-like MFS transporter
MNAQVNAVGQVVGGPPLGALAGRATVSTALVVSAGLLSPAVAIFGWLGRHRAPGPEAGPSDPPAQ